MTSKPKNPRTAEEYAKANEANAYWREYRRKRRAAGKDKPVRYGEQVSTEAAIKRKLNGGLS